MKNAPRRSRLPRGFTLIELMVVLSAALFFSVTVFMLTRDVSRFFEREARLSDATMASASGFRRLSNDIARSGFLASPNLAKDPRRCPSPVAKDQVGSAPSATGYASFPLLQKLAMLRITVGGSVAGLSGDFAGVLTNNSLSPDSIILYGNYSSNEAFPTQGFSTAGGQTTFTLDTNSGALFRTGYFESTLTPAQRSALLATLFPPGRILRILSQVGEEQYAIIETSNAPVSYTTVKPTVTTKSTGPQLIQKATNGVCGARGLQEGFMINTVNVIQYNLRDVSNAGTYPRLAYLFTNQARHPRDVATRIDLVRSELDPSTAGTDFADSVEVVAENVVDLKFGLDAVTTKSTFTPTYLAPGDAAIPTFAGDSTSTAAGVNLGPHLIRGVRVRMSTRAAAPDRDGYVNGTDVGTGLYRVALSWTGGTLKDYVRVRTLETTVITRNSRYELW